MSTEVQESQLQLVTIEIELTKLLASNDAKIRSEGIKQIKQLLLKHSENTGNAFQLNDYLIIWRGLFYFMWMSDKPLPQEDATEKISNLIHCCKSHQGKILFLEAFFLTIKDDWMSISQHRIDKFMMLVRRCLRQILFTFVNCDWDLEYMQKFNEVLYRALKSFTLSLKSHIQEIFLEELAKVSKGEVPSEALVIILDAFLHFISELNDSGVIKEIIKNVFRNLLSQSPELEILEAKYQAWKKLGKPGSSYNELELIDGDISDNDSNEQNNGPLDPRAGNVSVEIPRIKFNPKDVSKLLNKYITEIDCSRKCLIEITKLLKWYNRLGEGILPYKPKDLKLNSQVLKRKKRKHLSKMIKEGVKRLEMVDCKIKKNSREVNDYKSLKELDKMGEIIVEHGKIGKSVWKVRKFDDCPLKENVCLNGSWTVSDEAKTDDASEGITSVKSDDEPPLLIPAQSNVSSENSSPSLKSLTSSDLPSKKSSLTKQKSPKSNIANKVVSNVTKKLISPSIKNKKSPNILKISANNVESFLEHNKEFANVKKPFVSSPKTPENIKKERKSGTFGKHNVASIEVKSPKFNKKKSDSIEKILESKSPINDLVMSKVKRNSTEIITNTSLNASWTVCDDEKLVSIKQSAMNSSPNTSVNTSFSVSVQNDNSLSKKAVKRSSLTSTTTPEKNSKSPKSPTPEKRVLRRRTIVIQKKKLEDQKDVTPKKKAKNATPTIPLEKRRKTITGDEITMSMLKPEEISNKALEKVRSEAFENGLGTPRKSSRLSVKSDSAKKRVEFQLRNNIEQEFMEYRTSLKTNKNNPHDASKQPVHSVLKLTPDPIRVNPFYKFKAASVKKNSRKSVI